MRKGSKHTEEAKRRIAAALLGRERGPVSPEHHARMCAAQQSRRARERQHGKVSSEHHARMCAAQQERRARERAARG